MQTYFFTLLLLFVSVSAYDFNLRRSINGTRVGSFSLYIQDATVSKVSDMEYSLSGYVTYSGWWNCDYDVKNKNLKLVCLVTEQTMGLELFTASYYFLGSTVNCGGNKINDDITFQEIKEPHYYGCAVTDGTYVYEWEIINYIHISLPWWIIAIVVVIILCCVCSCAAGIYYRCKHPKTIINDLVPEVSYNVMLN